ncbi:MAG: hypothetical protein KGI04_00175 [Candidatus Micrarchaeota archaeon]|nr:hypothetical protein [Candidatus Micrarchaeota archaeon]
MRRFSRVRRSSRERYRELAAGLLVGVVSCGIQTLLPNVINLVPVLIILGVVAPFVDDALAFLAGFAIASVALALFGIIGAGLFAFDILFAAVAVLAAAYSARGFRKGTYANEYLIAVAVAAVVLAIAYVFVSGSSLLLSPSTTVSTLNTTSTISVSSTTVTTTTTIVLYSGCSTVEYDQPFHCQNPVLSAPANLSFTLSSNDTSDTLYNLDLACTNTFNLSAPSKYDFYYLEANGTFTQGQYGTSITSSMPISAKGLPCYGISNVSAPFNGILWVQYNPGSVATPLQTTHIEVYYNTSSVPALMHVNSTLSETH